MNRFAPDGLALAAKLVLAGALWIPSALVYPWLWLVFAFTVVVAAIVVALSYRPPRIVKPSGTISVLAATSPGIEPVYGDGRYKRLLMRPGHVTQDLGADVPGTYES